MNMVRPYYSIYTCVICAERLPSWVYSKKKVKLCVNCSKLYKQYANTDWFKELEKLQAKQEAIDRFERYSLEPAFETHIHKLQDMPKQTKGKVGRPSISKEKRDHVLEIFDKSYKSLREIAKETGVYQLTVRNILLKYRKEQYEHVCKIKRSV